MSAILWTSPGILHEQEAMEYVLARQERDRNSCNPAAIRSRPQSGLFK
jgi:hypothetical protein